MHRRRCSIQLYCRRENVSDQTREALIGMLATALPDRDFDRALVGDKLVALVRAAERRWPAIQLLAAQFIAHLAPLLSEDVVGALDKLHGDDLYLACACLAGDA